MELKWDAVRTRAIMVSPVYRCTDQCCVSVLPVRAKGSLASEGTAGGTPQREAAHST